MDPNVALENLRNAISSLDDSFNLGEACDTYDIEQVIDSFAALDYWMRKGGFIPKDWAENR